MEELQRGVEVGVDEAAHLGAVEPFEPVPQPPVARRLGRSRESFDLGLHGVRFGVHVESAAVGEAGAVGGVQRDEVEPVAHVFADGGEGGLGEVRHGQHGGPGVEPVSAALQQPGPSAGPVRPLHDRHPPPGAEEMERGGQPGEPGPDDDHVVGGPGDGAHRAAHRTAPADGRGAARWRSPACRTVGCIAVPLAGAEAGSCLCTGLRSL